ncbi:ATP-binding protein [Paraferrimonas sp. SM1919]|uniref:ATP-binding protein n=1 Tax=Paraferrimonas sp. SM1919 TaxID=2662263 RepID=UPI0013D22735|nr:ATP-binding protein [Paraferrimonas sp. SM1919]
MKTAPSLSKYLISRLGLLAGLLVVVVFFLQWSLANYLEKQNQNQQLEQALQDQTNNLKQILANFEQQVQSIANNSIVINGLVDFNGRQQYLPLYLDTVSILGKTNIAVRLVDFENNLIESNFMGATLKFPDQSLWLSTVLENGETWQQWHKTGIYIATPVRIRNLPEGAILIFIESNILNEHLFNVGSNYGQQLATAAGEVIYSRSPTGQINLAEQLPSDKYILSNQQPLLDGALQIRLYALQPDLIASVGRYGVLILATMLFVLFGLWLILLETGNQIKKILSNLTKAILKVANSQDLDARVDFTHTPKELTFIGQQFNNMLVKLQQTTTSRDEIHSIIHSMTESVYVCDQNFIVKMSNRINEIDSDSTKTIDQIIKAPTNHPLFDPQSAVNEFEAHSTDESILWHRSVLQHGDSSVGWVFTGSDFSEIKKAQRQLQILQLAINSSSNGIIVVDAQDPSEPIIFANEGFTNITGFKVDEILGRRCDFLQGKKTSLETRKQIAIAIQNKKSVLVEILNYHKNGTPFWNRLSIDPVIGDDGKVEYFLGVLSDITSLVSAREELRIAKDKAEAATLSKSNFLAMMSHEIRTPMNGVIGMLRLLLDTTLTSQQLQQAKIAHNSAKSLLTLINDILDFSKIEAGKLELEQIEFDIRELLAQFVESIAPTAHAKGLDIMLDDCDITHTQVSGDPNRLSQILTNLVANAIKFTEKGEILLQAGLQKQSGNWWLKVKVKDTGIGIANDKLNSLFQPFNQLDKSTTRKYGGTGLGLIIVKRLCQQMGGDICVTSAEGVGSEFEFRVLVQVQQNEQQPIPQEIKGKQFAVISSSKTFSELLKKRLNLWQAKLQVFADEEEALIALEGTTKLDYILYDINAFAGKQTFLNTVSDKRQTDDIKFIGMATIDQLHSLTREVKSRFDFILLKPLSCHSFLLALKGKSMTAVGFKGSEIKPEAPLTKFANTTRVLVVDDNRINQTVAISMLRTLGIQPDYAENGEQAIESLKATINHEPYNLVLMDCHMPVMDGYTATQAIRNGAAGAANSNIIIVAMTANVMNDDRQKCIDSGMNDFIPKPVELATLSDVLSRYLATNETNGQPRLLKNNPQTEAKKAIWERAELLDKLEQNEALVITILEMYLDENDSRTKQLNQAYQANEIEQLATIAHGLKGVTANLSAKACNKAALALEQACKNKDMDNIESLLLAFHSENQQLIDEFSAYIKLKEQASAAQSLTAKQLIEKLTQLKSQLKQHMFIDVSQYRALLTESNVENRQIATKLVRLYRSLEHFEEEEALTLLNSILEALLATG